MNGTQIKFTIIDPPEHPTSHTSSSEWIEYLISNRTDPAMQSSDFIISFLWSIEKPDELCNVTRKPREWKRPQLWQIYHMSRFLLKSSRKCYICLIHDAVGVGFGSRWSRDNYPRPFKLHWTLNVEHWTVNAEHWTLNIERWTLDGKSWTLSVERWTHCVQS